MTVSAVAKFIPNPPALVDSRKQKAADPGAKHNHDSIVIISSCNCYITLEITVTQSIQICSLGLQKIIITQLMNGLVEEQGIYIYRNGYS